MGHDFELPDLSSGTEVLEARGRRRAELEERLVWHLLSNCHNEAETLRLINSFEDGMFSFPYFPAVDVFIDLYGEARRSGGQVRTPGCVARIRSKVPSLDIDALMGRYTARQPAFGDTGEALEGVSALVQMCHWEECARLYSYGLRQGLFGEKKEFPSVQSLIGSIARIDRSEGPSRRMDQGMVAHLSSEITLDLNSPDRFRLGTGFSVFDRYAGGLYRGGINVILARPGERKTTFLTNVLANYLSDPDLRRRATASPECPGGRPMRIVVFSLEMPLKRVFQRTLMAMSCEVDTVPGGLDPQESAFTIIVKSRLTADDCRNGTDQYRACWQKAAEQSETCRIVIDDTENKDIDSIINTLNRETVINGEPDLVMIDYFQTITPSRSLAEKSRLEQLSDVSSQLRSFCRYHPGCAILLLAQARRTNAQGRFMAYPSLEDVAECDKLSRDAWLVATISRNHVESETKDAARKSGGSYGLEIVKNREGAMGFEFLSVLEEQQKIIEHGTFSHIRPPEVPAIDVVLGHDYRKAEGFGYNTIAGAGRPAGDKGES